MHKIKVVCVVVTAAVLCSGAWCQTATKTQLEMRKLNCLMNIAQPDEAKRGTLSRAAQTAEARGSGSDEWAVIRDAQANLRLRYADSFTDSDVKEIACQAWADYREHNPKGQLDKLDLASFEKYAADNYGGLKVLSRPDGAAIEVDTVSWDGPTNAQNMCRVGPRHVRLSKPGYYDEVGDVLVSKGQWAIFERKLREKKP